MSVSGDRIRELRHLHHMTMDDVAHCLNVGRQAVYKYETGTVTNIPLDNIEKMAELFNVSPGYIAGWSSTPWPDGAAASDLEKVAEESRVPPPGVVIPDSALFLRVMDVLSADDLATMTDIFARAAHKLKEKEENENA